MANFLYFDIETIPCQDAAMCDYLAGKVSAAKNLKDPEKIAAQVEAKAAEIIDKTSFDGFAGHVVQISWAVDDGEVISETVKHTSLEADVLEMFFCHVENYCREAELVGHNITGFDIPFLTRRALVLGVPLPKRPTWPRDVKPWSANLVDTMTILGGKDWLSLDYMCRALGIQGKEGMTGADVYPAWKAGEHDKIAAYCASDVEKVRAVHQRFIKAGW